MKDEYVEVKQDSIETVSSPAMQTPFAELDALLKAQDLKPATQDDTRGNS